MSARGAGERLSSGLRGWVEGPIFRGSWDIIEGSRAELSHSNVLHLLLVLGSMTFASSNEYGAPILCQALCIGSPR